MIGDVIKYEQDNIDTDVIIPGTYLKIHDYNELATHAMEGLDPDFPSKVKDGDFIVAGKNFGCGSSREHAPWALVDYGFKAIVSTSFADIFKNNSLKNGLIPISVPEEMHKWLIDNPGVDVMIDLENTLIQTQQGHESSFPVESFSRYCLMNGIDQLGYILSQETEITKHENKL